MKLLSELKLGPITLKNRIIMAPLTRMRSAQPGNIPQELNEIYYAQRASAGLIITEATQVSQQGQGYPGTPGIHNMSTPAEKKSWCNYLHWLRDSVSSVCGIFTL